VPTISVQKLRELADAGTRLRQEIQMLHDRISRKAYDVYQTRGAADGSSLDDWLRAEREVRWAPQEELQETDRAFHVMIGVSAVADETIEVTLLPEMIILRGASENGCDTQCGTDSYEPSPKVLFRRIVFPSQIGTESAVIRLEADLLRESAAKVESG